jgi:hypothetical protein
VCIAPGALFVQSSVVEVANATFLANEATAGSALHVEGGSLELSRSALDGTGEGTLCGFDAGSFTSNGYNVATPAPFGCDLDGPKDKLVDPLLAGALDDNGGPTDTIRLGPGSPALDRIPNNKCGPAEGVDQRGFGRPAGKACDSGAFERGATPD